jgi:AcrR family transcriptional regulator
MESPMPRKPSPDRRQRFLDAALRLFVENGVPGTSTAAIAKAAGSAAGTLFLYFPSKQDLVDELVLQIGRVQAATIQTRLQEEQHDSARDSFWIIWHGSVCWLLDNLDAFLFIQQVRESRLISPAAIRESEQFFGYFYETIQRGLADTAIKPYPSDLVGGILYHDIVAVINCVRAQADQSLREQTIADGFDIFWHGIRA